MMKHCDPCSHGQAESIGNPENEKVVSNDPNLLLARISVGTPTRCRGGRMGPPQEEKPHEVTPMDLIPTVFRANNLFLKAYRCVAICRGLRPDLAEQVIADRIMGLLGLEDVQSGVWTMIETFAEGLAAEIRNLLKRQSWFAEKTILTACGGSGSLLACIVAERVGLPAWISPPESASFSAHGVGFVNLAHEYRVLLRGEVNQDRWQEAIKLLRAHAEPDIFGE